MGEIIAIPGFAEPFSSLSHLIGAVVFALLSVPMLLRARKRQRNLIAVAVFCFGAVSLLSISGVYHLLDPEGKPHNVVRLLDHAAIFVLIAGSFTPVHAILFQGIGRWGVLILIWAIAIVGITLKTLFFNSFAPGLGLGLYLGMGWIGLGTWLSLKQRFDFKFLQPLMWGGFAYSIGGILYGISWPNVVTGVIGPHEIFHIAVLAGLGFHWAFIYHIADREKDVPFAQAKLAIADS